MVYSGRLYGVVECIVGDCMVAVVTLLHSKLAPDLPLSTLHCNCLYSIHIYCTVLYCNVLNRIYMAQISKDGGDLESMS